jgi:hypothetical protein
MSTKTCTICNLTKPEDQFVSKTSHCKPCFAKNSREKYKKKQEKLLKEIEEKGAENVILKCSKCQQNKTADNFNKTYRNCKDCNTKINKLLHSNKMEKQKQEGYSYDFEKKCSGCNVVKKGIEFSKNDSYCKNCKKVIQKNEYEKNRVVRIQKNREYRKKRVESNIEFKSENNKRICKKCLQELDCNLFSICGGNFLQTVCKPCRAEESREYRKNNQDIIKKYKENNKIKENSRARVKKLVKKEDRITREEMFGCSLTQFQEWLKFCCIKLTYDYDKCGKEWEIDHVIPCKCFNLEENKEEQIACFHWTNMVPLESKLNSSKRDKIILIQIDKVVDFLKEYIQLNNLNEENELRYWRKEYQNKIDTYPKHKIRKTFRLVNSNNNNNQ